MYNHDTYIHLVHLQSFGHQVRPLQTSASGFAQLEIKCLLGIDYPNRRKRGEEEHSS